LPLDLWSLATEREHECDELKEQKRIKILILTAAGFLDEPSVTLRDAERQIPPIPLGRICTPPAMSKSI
jgi:hypothetical protein